MKTFKIGEKTAVYLCREELEKTVGFAVEDYVTLALGIKEMYKTYNAVITDFDGEIYIAEGYNITPVGANFDADRIVDVERDCNLNEYFALYLSTENGERD